MEMKKNFVINAAFYAILAGLVLAAYRYILPILMPFVIGFCVASIVQIPLRKFKYDNTALRRWMATLLCVAFYALVVTLLILFGAKVVTEIGNLVGSLPDLFRDHMYPFFVYVAGRVMEILGPLDPSLAEWIIALGKDIAATIGQFATDVSAGAVRIVASGAASVPSAIVTVIVTVVSSFFIAADYRLVVNFLKKLIPQSHRTYVIQIIRYVEHAVLVYIKSYAILFFLTFLELWIGLAILKIPYALAIAIAIAVFDLMPILGTGGILLPWSVIAMVMGNFHVGLGVLILYVVITAVRNMVEPRIVGTQIGLHPLATMVAMILGLRLMGLIGMLLFPISLVAIINLKKSAEERTEID